MTVIIDLITSIRPLRTQLAIPRELVELALINTLQLRTAQLRRDRGNGAGELRQRGGDGGEQPLEQIGRALLRGLEGQARGVVAL
jgi:hypothetical protein